MEPIKLDAHEVEPWSRVYAAVVAACLVDRNADGEAVLTTRDSAEFAEERADAAVLALRERISEGARRG